MGQQADITVFDGAGTPVSHTLVGESVERLPDGSYTAVWKESLAGVPDYAQVRYIQTKRKLASGIWRISGRVEVPVMESISGQNVAGYTAKPKVAYVATYESVEYAHERSTIADRRLARQMSINIQGNISTSVNPAVNGPWPQLSDQLIQVT